MDAFHKNIGIFNIVVSSTPSNMKILIPIYLI